MKSAFRFFFCHNGGLVQTTPKRSLLKHQETRVIDESLSGMDTLWIRCGYLWLTKSVLKNVCAASNACRIDLIFD